MEIKRTDSLGLEILNGIIKMESGNAIKPEKLKEEAIKNIDQDNSILFVIYEGKIEKEYFVLDIEKYNKWVNDYKLEGVEI